MRRRASLSRMGCTRAPRRSEHRPLASVACSCSCLASVGVPRCHRGCRHGAHVVHRVVDDFLWGIANAGLPDPGTKHPGNKTCALLGGAGRGGHALIIYENDSVQDHVTSVNVTRRQVSRQWNCGRHARSCIFITFVYDVLVLRYWGTPVTYVFSVCRFPSHLASASGTG